MYRKGLEERAVCCQVEAEVGAEYFGGRQQAPEVPVEAAEVAGIRRDGGRCRDADSPDTDEASTLLLPLMSLGAASYIQPTSQINLRVCTCCKCRLFV